MAESVAIARAQDHRVPVALLDRGNLVLRVLVADSERCWIALYQTMGQMNIPAELVVSYDEWKSLVKFVDARFAEEQAEKTVEALTDKGVKNA